MPKWKAWSIIAVFLGLTGALLWLGLAIVVRCDRVGEGRVDATLERHFLGWLPLSRESVPDIVKAGIVVVRSGPGARANQQGVSVRLELTPRSGPAALRTRFGPSFGTQPPEMAEQIEQFLKEPTRPSFTAWWMPWLVNVGAVPFVLVLGGIVGEALLRALGFFKPSASKT